jgi:hypothetical protein
MAGMVAGFGNRSTWSSCVFHALGVVAKVGSGMETVRDTGRVSDRLLWNDLLSLWLEVDIRA